MEWVTESKQQIEVDSRHLKMQSAQAVRTVIEALVELITNSDDAYCRNDDSKGKILISVTRERGERSGIVSVIDRAGGLTLSEMNQKILRYGAFSAGKRTRGYMGRGAKDIVALGKASFQTIKEDYVHRIELDTDFSATIMKSVKAKAEHYEAAGVHFGKGGMQVSLEVIANYKVPRHDTLIRDLQRNYALREILQRREVRLEDGRTGKVDVLRYKSPAGELVYRDNLRFDDAYEEARAKIEIYRTAKELSTELQEGIIVTDGRAIYQVTRFAADLEEDPIARRFYGRLECPYVRELQLEFEQRRKDGLEILPENPVDIVDPNRRRGLDREAHPFVRKLFDWAEEILRALVDELKDDSRTKEKKVANDRTRKRLKALSKQVAEHLKKRIEEESLAPRTPEQQAVLQEEGVLLNPQFSKIEVGETRRLGYTVLSFGENEDPDHVSVTSSGKELVVDSSS